MRKTREDYIREYREKKEQQEIRLDMERREYGKLVKQALGFIDTPFREIDLPELEKCIRFGSLWLKKRIEEREWNALTPADMGQIWRRELKGFVKRFKK